MPPRQRGRGTGRRLLPPAMLLLLLGLVLVLPPMALAFVVPPGPPTCGRSPTPAAGGSAQQDGSSRARHRPLSPRPLWSGSNDEKPSSSEAAAAVGRGKSKGVDRRGAVGRGALLLALSLAASKTPINPVRPPPPAVAAVLKDADVITAPGKVEVFKGPIEQSPSDTKQYRAMTLANGLRVLLVSDPETERAAAAMDVHVGHFSDPASLPGLAHFCEHMLFLGTKGYPDENSYSQYLSAHGGSSNAYTDTEDTVYYFDVDSRFLEGALDRFAWFFKAPLFTPSATDRELNAIESENAKNLQSDGFRAYQLEKGRANPSHPFSKFGTGNLQTLRDAPRAQGLDTREALMAFHEKYYLAPRMTLTVVGKEPLDKLQRWAEGMFAQVPTREGARLSELEPWRYPSPTSSGATNPPPFLPSSFGKALHVVPVQPLRRLQLTWVVPFKDEAARRQSLIDKPEYYVSHLLGHEGEGSLLSYLKRQGLANALAAGFTSEMGDFALYDVAIDLTEQGEKQRERIQEAVFSFLALLRQKANGGGGSGAEGGGIPGYVFEECKALADIAWRFQEKSEPISLASALVNNMQSFPASLYLAGPARLFEVKPAAVRELVELLTPARALVTVVSKSFEKEADREERWYKTKYKEVDLSPQLQKLAQREAAYIQQKDRNALPLLAQGQLRVHAPNPFLPRDLALKAPVQPRPAVGAPIPGPTLLEENESWRIFHKQDRTFGKPKVYAIFQVANPLFSQSPQTVALTRLLKLAIVDSLTEFAYPAALAGLSFDIDFTVKGLRLTVGGYHDKLPDFARAIAQRLAAYRGPQSDGDFNRYKDLVARELEGFDSLQPYMHAGYFANLALEDPKWPIADIRKALKGITRQDLVAFTAPESLFGRGFGTALLQGNILPDEALSLAKSIQDTLKFGSVLPKEERTSRRITQLPLTPQSTRGLLLRRPEPNAANNNGAVELIFQIGALDLKTKVTAELLSELVEQPFYDELRTQQQLGYLVFSGVRVTERVPSLVFIVQSTVADPQNLADRMLQFVQSIGSELLAKLSQADFDAFVVGLVGKKLEREKRLEQEAVRHWEEISLGDFMYDRPQQEAAALKKLTKADVQAFYENYIRISGPARRLLTAQVYPSQQRALLQQPIAKGGEVIDDEIEDELAFRRSRPVYGGESP